MENDYYFNLIQLYDGIANKPHTATGDHGKKEEIKEEVLRKIRKKGKMLR